MYSPTNTKDSSSNNSKGKDINNEEKLDDEEFGNKESYVYNRINKNTNDAYNSNNNFYKSIINIESNNSKFDLNSKIEVNSTDKNNIKCDIDNNNKNTNNTIYKFFHIYNDNNSKNLNNASVLYK